MHKQQQRTDVQYKIFSYKSNNVIKLTIMQINKLFSDAV